MKTLPLLCGWLLLAAAPAQAQSPFPPLVPDLPSVTLGRLFNTAEARAAMDSQRSGQAPAPTGQPAMGQGQNAGPIGAAAVLPVEQPPVMLDGVVRRSSGKSTVWLNQQPQNDENNHLLNNGALTLRTSNGRRVILKPGQSYDVNNGLITESPPSR